MVEQFTRWQTEVDGYRMAFENYRDANNIKIELLWEFDSNWQGGLSLVELTAIQATN